MKFIPSFERLANFSLPIFELVAFCSVGSWGGGGGERKKEGVKILSQLCLFKGLSGDGSIQADPVSLKHRKDFILDINNYKLLPQVDYRTSSGEGSQRALCRMRYEVHLYFSFFFRFFVSASPILPFPRCFMNGSHVVLAKSGCVMYTAFAICLWKLTSVGRKSWIVLYMRRFFAPSAWATATLLTRHLWQKAW